MSLFREYVTVWANTPEGWVRTVYKRCRVQHVKKSTVAPVGANDEPSLSVLIYGEADVQTGDYILPGDVEGDKAPAEALRVATVTGYTLGMTIDHYKVTA